MRPSRVWSAVILSFCFATTLIAQNQSSSSLQALTTLQSAFQALSGKMVINDVTLTGTAEWIVGSDDETGTVVLKTTGGANRLDLNLSASTRSEIRSITASGPVGSWVGPDGVSHSMAQHNLRAEAGWFPAFTIGNLISNTNAVVASAGMETRNSASVIHISLFQQSANQPTGGSGLSQHLTQVELYLDPSTLLPVSYIFNSHPDNNAALDFPTEIRYSNYQNIGGAQIPLHIQKFINNTLTLDLHFQNASLNTGLTAAQISAQ
jgi:hypothetical protein